MGRRGPVERRGLIDARGDPRDWDLTAFSEGENPWSNDYLQNGFVEAARYYRSRVRKWGFAGLGNIADLGCGFGVFSIFLAEVNLSVTGYELKPGASDLARRIADFAGLPNARFEQADIGALPAEDGAFDGAWLNNTLQVVRRARVLAEARRILRPNGRLFVGEYRGLGRLVGMFGQGYARGGIGHTLARAAISAFRNGPGHDGVNSYASEEQLEAMLARSGFRLSGKHPILCNRVRSRARVNPFADQFRDLPALADRLESDPAFAAAFARRRGAAGGLVYWLSFCAVKI